MKKKFSLWLNIATICLCVCAIAIGVYAVQSATLSVTGSVGFSTHGVEMEITGTLSGYVSSSNVDTATATETKTLDKVILSKTNTSGEMSLGDFNFTDLVDDGATDIVLTLNLTNKSKFPVEVTKFTLPSDQVLQNNVDFDVQNGFAQMGSVSDTETSTQTITITMSLAKEDPTKIDTKDFSISIKFEKYQKIKGNSTTGYYATMGSNVVTTTSGDNRTQTVTPVKWIPIAKYNENSTGAENLYKYDAFSNKTELTSGSYYFISENILDSKDSLSELPDRIGNPLGIKSNGKYYGVAYVNKLDGSYSTKANYEEFYGQDYLISSVRELLTSEDGVQQYAKIEDDSWTPYGPTISLLKEYGLQGYTYASITERKASELYEKGFDQKTYDDFQVGEKSADKLWLLSQTEANKYFTDNTARKAKIFLDTEESGFWWLRSPLAENYLDMWSVYSSGEVGGMEAPVWIIGVRPAFTLTI